MSLPTEMNNRVVSCILEEIRKEIKRSPVPEDPIHAENTLQWVLRLAPDAGVALRIAALGHDIERAAPKRVQKGEFETLEAFKQAHADRSARILRGIMEACGADGELTEAVIRLVRRHETGGTPEADLLKEADSLSFFDTNIARFFEREGWTTTQERALWGLRRLSEASRRFLIEIDYEDPELEILVKSCLNKLRKLTQNNQGEHDD